MKLKFKILLLLKTTLILSIVFYSNFYVPLFSKTFTWESKQQEPTFTIDIPNNWRESYTIKDNGSIVYFAYKQGLIEVKSLIKDNLDLQDVVNSKIARLVTEHENVKILDSQKIKFRKDTYILSWEFKSEGIIYYEQNILILRNNKLLSLSCLVPKRLYPNYRIIFENALYSVHIVENSESDVETTAPTVLKAKKVRQEKNIQCKETCEVQKKCNKKWTKRGKQKCYDKCANKCK